MLTNQEKIEILQNRINIVNWDITILNNELQFYKNEGLDEKVQVALYKISEKQRVLYVLQLEFNNLNIS